MMKIFYFDEIFEFFVLHLLSRFKWFITFSCGVFLLSDGLALVKYSENAFILYLNSTRPRVYITKPASCYLLFISEIPKLLYSAQLLLCCVRIVRDGCFIIGVIHVLLVQLLRIILVRPKEKFF